MSRPGPGKGAEQRALRWYRLRGYRILAANEWVAGYELDLIVRRGRRIVFCEVKAKTSDRYCDPFEIVTLEKQRRLRRAAEGWLARHPELDHLEQSFDVVAERGGRLERLQNAF